MNIDGARAVRRDARALRAMAGVTLTLLLAAPASAQFNSGSSGIHGVFPPGPVPASTVYLLWNLTTGAVLYCSQYDTTARPDTCTTQVGSAQIPNIPSGGLTTGIFEFTNFDMPATPQVQIYPVGYDTPTPLTILVQGAFTLRGTLHLEGGNGASTQAGIQPDGYGGVPGGRPGPGGFPGGSGGRRTPSTNGNPGFGPAGGGGGVANASDALGGNGGILGTASSVSTTLVPLVGGSGGGGGGGAPEPLCGFRGAGGGGGGGAGALLVAANTQITLLGEISAFGGGGGAGAFAATPCFNRGGLGGAGSVRLVSPIISGSGRVGRDPAAALGTAVVRLEGQTSGFTGFIVAGRVVIVGAPQPVVPPTFPALRITSVAGVAVGQNPTGSVATPDVTLPSPPAGSVPVALTAANVPVGTIVKVRASPLVGAATTADSSPLAGSLQSSSATASLAIPAGAGLITAVTSFPVTTALLEKLPVIPGLTPDRIELMADADGTSHVVLIGTEARRVELVATAGGRFAIAP